MRLLYFLPALLCPLLSGYHAAAQTSSDSTRVVYEEEVLAQPLRLDSVAPLRVQREVGGQWKLGLNNFTTGQPFRDIFYTRYGVHIAYERKVGAAFAVQGELSPAVVRYRRSDGQLRRAPSARVQLMGRYYYDLERRIRKGKNRGSFSGNYFALAFGTGLGRHTYDTPFYFYYPGGTGTNKGAADVALLYGVQRRLGRRGFIDANIGLTKLLEPISSTINVGGSLRVGLLVGSPPALAQPATRLGAADDATLRPRYYAGAQLGSYNYVVRFSDFDPYAARPGGIAAFFQRPGVGTYSIENKNPYYYVGYQLKPRLALQLGYQGQTGTYISSGIYSNGGSFGLNESETKEQTLAFPLLARYHLTRQYQKRMQFDVVGGAALVYARVRNQENRSRNGQATETYSFERQNVGTHLSGGLNASYGMGRQRKLQLTAEYVLIQNLQTAFTGLNATQAGGSLGVRYRFGPKF